MSKNKYLPEGKLINTEYNRSYLESYEKLEKACREGIILEGRSILCDNERNLHIDLGMFRGIIPREECVYSFKNEIKDIAILSRVGKPVCFKIIDVQRDIYGCVNLTLSRKAAQRECLNNYTNNLIAGTIIDGRVTHLENFGAFIDIGCGIISLLSIDCMSVSRISHPSDRFFIGQFIKVIVKTSTDETGRITLSHRELLGTWEENVSNFKIGQTAAGIVRSIENYGVFVELAPNLAGLAEVKQNVEIGQHTAVYIKNIIPEKMKVKLVMIDFYKGEKYCAEYKYYITDSYLPYWRYSPNGCDKLIETVF